MTAFVRRLCAPSGCPLCPRRGSVSLSTATPSPPAGRRSPRRASCGPRRRSCRRPGRGVPGGRARSRRSSCRCLRRCAARTAGCVADQREAVDVGRSVGAHDASRLRAHLARNLADDPLHQRFERHQARRPAVFVDDQRLARPCAAASRRADRRRRALSGTVSTSRASAPALTPPSPPPSAFTRSATCSMPTTSSRSSR